MSFKNNIKISIKTYMIQDNYNILIELGSGSFGSVWKVLDIHTNEEFAMKIEEKNNKSRLKNEYNIYRKLIKNGLIYGIPKIKCYFESNKKCYMIMELLGKSLDQILNELPNGFEINNVLYLGKVIISLLEIIHNLGYLHRDIKPNNFLFGHTDNNLYIMDFGLSKKYIDDNGQHIKLKIGKSLIGTARYASINVHNGYEPSRRDDLESVGYMLIYLITKKLPWQGLKKQENVDQTKIIGECKKNTPLDILCKNLPNCFKSYLEYCKNLEYDENPNYIYLKNLFEF